MSYIVWHFANNDKKLGYGDGREIVEGQTLSVEGDIILCGNGMHGSFKALDALQYAFGSVVTLCELSGDIVTDSDKIAGRTRKVLKMVDASDVLFEFACIVAERALNKQKEKGFEPHPDSYKAIQARRDYQAERIGDAELDTAWFAAKSAAWSAAMSAAMSATGSAEKKWQNTMLENLLFELLGYKHLIKTIEG